MATHVPIPPAAARPAAVHMFGRLQLLRLLGKSERSMAWRVQDPASGQELMLVLPRAQCQDAASLERWQAQMRQVSRLSHPDLAAVLEVGVQDGWPYAAYELCDAAPLTERLSANGLPGAEAAALMAHTLRGLAYAHEAGMAHHDLQPFLLLVSDNGALRVAGLNVACDMAGQSLSAAGGSAHFQRDAAERDVLAAGVLLHALLAGQPVLEEPDIGRVLQRLPPVGRETVRLPWTLAQPVAEPLRAIVNRATDRQERQRYRNARTLERALGGWLQVDGEAGGGPILLLIDRMRAAGLLPAMPGGAARAARLVLMERERNSELAEIVLQDVGLAFELLRMVNSNKQRGAMGAGNGPILTIRRAIAMLGLDGVRRASVVLRPWPGPLAEGHADDLAALIDRVQLAGRVAQWLRPAGYDAEVVTLLAMLQNLGRLAVQYHFPEEAAQIRRLMLPAPPARAGEPEDPGMSEEGASFAVLGVDGDALGAAVGRHWGLEDPVLHLMRRVPLSAPVHHADSDDDLLRLTASCANEVVDSRAVPAHHRAAFLLRVVQRYGRALGVSLRDVQQSAQGIAPDQPADAAAPTDLPPTIGHAPAEARPSPHGVLR